jgi:hypothetical protein
VDDTNSTDSSFIGNAIGDFSKIAAAAAPVITAVKGTPTAAATPGKVSPTPTPATGLFGMTTKSLMILGGVAVVALGGLFFMLRRKGK